MEILKTSEVLESQILEDARKKASRLLESVEKECGAIRGEWEEKLAEDMRKSSAELAQRVSGLREKLSASLPLDFMRARLSYFEETMSHALKEFFASLPPEALARIIGRRLSEAAGAFRGEHVTVIEGGLGAQEARRVVEGSIPAVSVEEVKPMPPKEGAAPDVGIILQTSDGRKRYRGTVSEITSRLMEEQREELAAALLGKDA